MTAAVWIVGGPTDDDRDDLKHSLRSVAANAPGITETWVIGDVPDWFTGTRMPLEPKPSKFENQRASLTAFVNYPGAPDEAIIANDDMFVTEPIAGPLPIYRNKATASAWNVDHGKHGPSCWTCAVKTCAAWMAERAGEDTHLYECHTPLTFSVPKLRDLINDYPDDLPFMVGEAFALAGVGGPGVHAGNAKVKAKDSLAAKVALSMPYLSGNPDSWSGDLGRLIREQFPRPCRWERPTPLPSTTPARVVVQAIA